DVYGKLPCGTERVTSRETGLRQYEVELSSRYHRQRPVELRCRRAFELGCSASQLWIDETRDWILQRVLGRSLDIGVPDAHFLARIHPGTHVVVDRRAAIGEAILPVDSSNRERRRSVGVGRRVAHDPAAAVGHPGAGGMQLAPDRPGMFG